LNDHPISMMPGGDLQTFHHTSEKNGINWLNKLPQKHPRNETNCLAPMLSAEFLMSRAYWCLVPRLGRCCVTVVLTGTGNIRTLSLGSVYSTGVGELA